MSFQGPAIVHYEVYALNGQRWTLHARFHKDEKDEALLEAKTVENSLGLCAKVIRETYYPGNNASEEVLVYSSPKSFRARNQTPVYRPRVSARGEPGSDAAFTTPDFRVGPKTKPPGSMGVALKLLLVVSASLTIAAGGAAIVNNLLAKFPSLVGAESTSPLTFVTFVIFFLASGVPMAMSVVGWRDADVPSEEKLYPPSVAFAPKDPGPPAEAVKPPLPPLEEPVAPPASRAEPDAIPPSDEKNPPEQEKKPEADAETAASATRTPSTSESTDPLEEFRIIMIRFLGSLLTEVKKFRPTLDTYNIFGIDLMLAGAIDVLGTQKNLVLEQKSALLQETIEVMGTKSETAKAFADKYEDYLVEPKYMSMVLVGRANMEALLNGADMTLDQVTRVFEAWNKPQQTTPAAMHIVTVLFTDMVGSTDLTQARGDHAAQEIVRRHNNIVRTALVEHAGKEIKHTGDGIMASFASASNGVEAAIAIQRACAANNEKAPDLALHLRIGLNAGEPIEEEDDLFGSTVQLSARLCAEAEADEILCTNVVRELSSGKDLYFLAKGMTELKGFKDPVPLYQVHWDGAPNGGKKDEKPKSSARSGQTKEKKGGTISS